MLFAIDIGHNCPPRDIGAAHKQYREDILAKQVGELVIQKLKARGHRTILVTPRTARNVNHSLAQRAGKANRYRANYFVSIHFNAAGNTSANGSEIYIYNYHSSARGLAQEVLNNIVDLGFTNRKVKARKFRVLELTRMPAILVECCFLTSDKDMQLFNAEKMATAIVDGLVGKDEEIPIPGKLKVVNTTYAKPSTKQSRQINRGELYTIKPGEYKAKLVADEEAHYVVELQQKIGDRQVHYIYSGHCQFLPE